MLKAFFFVEAETIFDAGLVPANLEYGSGPMAEKVECHLVGVGRPENQRICRFSWELEDDYPLPQRSL